jgi:hypothetical protein
MVYVANQIIPRLKYCVKRNLHGQCLAIEYKLETAEGAGNEMPTDFQNLSRAARRPLSARLRLAVAATAAISLSIGLAFLFGPELHFTLWPTPIAPMLMRFMGAIVSGSGFKNAFSADTLCRIDCNCDNVAGVLAMIGLVERHVEQAKNNPLYKGIL